MQLQTRNAMKLVFAIVSDEDAHRLISELNRANYRVTRLSTTGGFLKSGNTTLMCGVEDKSLEDALEIIRKYSKSRTTMVNASMDPTGAIGGFAPYPVQVKIGGATIFVVDVTHFEHT